MFHLLCGAIYFLALNIHFLFGTQKFWLKVENKFGGITENITLVPLQKVVEKCKRKKKVKKKVEKCKRKVMLVTRISLIPGELRTFREIT